MSVTGDDEWRESSGEIRLEQGEVQVWLANLESASTILQNHLSVGESNKASRFVRPEDRLRWAASRGILRELLGSYLRVAPAGIEFQFNSFGKPSLGGEHATSGIQFNVSHSHGWALLAFVRNRAVGVDLERILPETAGDGIGDSFFSPIESMRLRSLPEIEQVHAFFECWTRKEAYIKARGDGFSCPLDSFSVAFGSGVAPGIIFSSEGPEEAASWQVVNLNPASDYCGALVIEGPEILVRQLRFAEPKPRL